jgi:hypothetical protein
MDRARLRSAVAPLVIAAAACAATRLPIPSNLRHDGGVGSSPAASATAELPSAGADVIALLDGLAPGDSLAGFRVRAIRAPRDRRIAVELEGADLALTVVVVIRGSLPHSAPRSTARYDLFYDEPRGGRIETDAVAPLLGALAERIARVEDHTPTPSGL